MITSYKNKLLLLNIGSDVECTQGLLPPDHGSISFKKEGDNYTVSYTCDDGYKLIGDDTLVIPTDSSVTAAPECKSKHIFNS